MNKIIFSFLTLLIAGLNVNANNFSVSGTVKDQNGNPKSGVVILVHPVTEDSLYFPFITVLTDNTGKYSAQFDTPANVSTEGIITATMIDCDNRTQVKSSRFSATNTRIEISFTYCLRTIANSCGVKITRVGNYLVARPSGGKKPYSYNWSTGSTASYIRMTNSTQRYCVSVTDSQGCLTSTCYTQETPRCAVELSLQGNVLKAMAINSSEPNDYRWSNGSSAPTIVVNSTGTYCVTMTNARGCLATACKYVQIDTNRCQVTIKLTNSGSLEIIASNSDQIASILWSNGATTRTITPNEAGRYCVVVKYTNGCVADACFTFQPTPTVCTVNITRDGNVLTANTTLGVNNATYIWNTGSTTQRTEIVSTRREYCVTVTSSNTNCITKTCYIVTNTNPIDSCVVNIVKDGDRLVAVSSSNSAVSYLWSTGAATQSIPYPTTPGVYSVTIKNTQGCFAKATYVVAGLSCSIQLRLSQDLRFLIPTATGTAPFTYRWSDGTTRGEFPIPLNNPIGASYCVTVTDAANCVASTCYLFSNPSCQVTITRDSLSNVLKANVPGNVSEYDFYWVGGPMNQVYATNGPGTYTVEIRNRVTGCTSRAVYTYTRLNADPTEKLVSGRLYPNPVSGDQANLLVESNEPTLVQVRISDLTGKVIYNQREMIGAGNSLLSIPTSEYTSGTYILQVMSDSKYFLTEQLVIIK